MTARCAPPPRRPEPLYFAEVNYGKLGVEFQALDRDKNSRKEIVREIRNGSNPVRILEVIEPCEDFPYGRVVDCTAELIAEANEPRDPPELDEQCRRLRNMLAEQDRRRDLRKHGVFGW